MADLSTLQDLFERLDAYGDATALAAFSGDERRELSFRELCAQSREIAAGLLDQGCEPGEAIALYGTNSIEWVTVRFALVLVGAVCVPVDFDADADRLMHLLQDSGARRLFVSPGLLETAEAALKQLEAPVATILLAPSESGGGHHSALDDLKREPKGRWPSAKPEDVVSRFYTSGTMGMPKAVPLSHANILTNLRVLSGLKLAGPKDRVLLPLPLHHSFPYIVGLLLPLMSGATVVFPAGVTGPALLRALREADVTVLVGVPRLYTAMMDGIESRIRGAGLLVSTMLRLLFRLSLMLRRRLGVRWGRALLAPVHRRVAPNLHVLASGGARLDEDLAWRLEGLGYQVLSGYGLVETTSVATFNSPGASRLGSAGKAPEGVSVRIQPVPEMEEGEIQIRGPIVFKGYLNNEDANAGAFTDDGWFRTGDLGHLDEDGFLHITGRLKEVIVLPGGKNVDPSEVERAYLRHRLIDEIAVMERDEKLIALVVPNVAEARASSVNDLGGAIRVAIGEAGQALPSYMRVADFALTREELPKNPLGKYKRHQLPELFERVERGEARAPQEWSAEDERRLSTRRGQLLMDLLHGRYPDQRLGPDTSLQMDLGIDSLAWVQLTLDLERRLGVSLSEDQIAELSTVGELLEAIEGAEEISEPKAAGEERLGAPEDRLRWLEPPGPLARAGGLVLYGLVWVVTRTFLRLRVQRRDKIPESGPLIVAVNHQSDVDPVIVGAALPYRTMRSVWWGAEGQRVFGNSAGRLLARIAHLFPVDERAPSASLESATEVLNRDQILVWFPESWRSPTGEIQEFRPGIGVLVERTGADILPCLVSGAIDVLPRNARLPRPRPVSCRFGKRIAADKLLTECGEVADGDRHSAIARKVREAVVALQDQTSEGLQ
jgi:long-chain acyl-CoA synthetase